MSATMLQSYGTVNYADSTVASCSSSTLSSLFASFLVGENSTELHKQKYFDLYNIDSERLISVYNKHESLPERLYAAAVRLSQTSSEEIDDEKTYYATFIATIDGTSYSFTPREAESKFCLALRSGEEVILATADFNSEVYDKLCDGNRVEIKWRLCLS